MRHIALLAAAALFPATIGAAQAQPVDRFEHKGRGEWVREYDDGYRSVKRERKRDEYKEEVKYGNDVAKYEEKADGSWKEEIKEGDCEIKRERTSSGEYKEERKC
jgi:hypothetical protein